jgi:membrane protease YdiL (CAAX protease family)
MGCARCPDNEYLVAVFLPALLIVVAVCLNILLGASAPTIEQFSRWPSVVFFFLLFLVLPIAAPLGEEPGWRGFAQPALMVGRSALMASLILGMLWAGWHLPLIVIWNISSWALIPLIIPSAVIMTWIYLHTRGSVLLAIIYHASFDAVTNLVAEIYTGTDLARVTLVLAIVFCVAALTLVVIMGPDLHASQARPRA